MRVLGKGVAGATGVLLAVLVAASSGAGAVHRDAATLAPRTALTGTTTQILPASITLAVAPKRVLSGEQVTLSGHASGFTPGAVVDIYRSPYPYRSPTLWRTAPIGSNGSYSVTDVPDRTTRYRATLPGTTAQAEGQAGVIIRSVTKVKPRPLGRARVTIVIFHPRDLQWGHARVRWWFGHGKHGRFKRFPATRTARLSPYTIAIWTAVPLPAGPFRWRVCLQVPQAHAFLNPRRPHGCSTLGYHGGGYLPYGYPGPGAVSRASHYLGGRTGRTAYAVVDTEARISGLHTHWTFVSASVVKAMLLVAYLRRLHQHHQHSVDGYSNSFLYPMINVSDNNAATQCWSIVGDSGLYSVAHAAHMTDFSIVGIWANAQISAADQAKFFFGMDSVIPREFVGYARHLLSTIAGYESWGIPAVGRPRGYQVFFKGGWRSTGLGQLVHQAGRLEGHHRRFSIAVMTDGDPDMGYGIGTIQGVTASLL